MLYLVLVFCIGKWLLVSALGTWYWVAFFGIFLTLVTTVQIAKAEKLKPMEVELKKLEDLSESIVNDFAYMRAREEEMRDTNGERAPTISGHCH